MNIDNITFANKNKQGMRVASCAVSPGDEGNCNTDSNFKITDVNLVDGETYKQRQDKLAKLRKQV
jgi:hypothetical protein